MSNQKMIADIDRELGKGKKAQISQADIRSLVYAFKTLSMLIDAQNKKIQQLESELAERKQEAE
jgi:hypothetical protein